MTIYQSACSGTVIDDSCLRATANSRNQKLDTGFIHRRITLQSSSLRNVGMNKKDSIQILIDAASEIVDGIQAIKIQAAVRGYFCRKFFKFFAMVPRTRRPHLQRAFSEITMGSDFGGDSLHSLGTFKKGERHPHNCLENESAFEEFGEDMFSTTFQKDFESSQSTIIQAVARGYLYRKDRILCSRPKRRNFGNESVSSLGDTLHSLLTSSSLGDTRHSTWSSDLQSECDTSHTSFNMDDQQLSTEDNYPMDLPIRAPLRQSSCRLKNLRNASCPNLSPTPEQTEPTMDLPLTPPMQKSSTHIKLVRDVRPSLYFSDSKVPAVCFRDTKSAPSSCLKTFRRTSCDSFFSARDEPVKQPERQKSRRSLLPSQSDESHL
jgi:hypothetical protein